MRAAQTDVFVNKRGHPYKHMSLEQRVALRKHYVATIPRWRHPLLGYVIAIVLAGLTILCSLYWQHLLVHFIFPGILSVLAILLVALFWGAGPALVTLALSTLALDYFFVPPIKQMQLDNWQGELQLLPFVISGLAIALITAQRERARLRALATEQELLAYAEELERINQKLEDANQTKDHFISVASHELKTPITTIRGQAQLMLRRLARQKKTVPEMESATRALQRIDEQTSRLTSLIDELLDVSSMRTGKAALHKASEDLGALCREVIEDQRLLTQRQLMLEIPEKPVNIVIDRDRLAQVLINLISNAIKYSPEDTPVEVKVSEDGGEHALIQVCDHGCGITEDQCERIFDTFYRTPDAQSSSMRGLGLGLAISKDIVERHGGRIWCESEVGNGSAFCVKLPLK